MNKKARLAWINRHLTSLYTSRAMINQAIHELEAEKAEMEKPMTIDYSNWGTAKGVTMGRIHKVFKKLFGHKPVPLCQSDHYIPEHFHK